MGTSVLVVRRISRFLMASRHRHQWLDSKGPYCHPSKFHRCFYKDGQTETLIHAPNILRSRPSRPPTATSVTFRIILHTRKCLHPSHSHSCSLQDPCPGRQTQGDSRVMGEGRRIWRLILEWGYGCEVLGRWPPVPDTNYRFVTFSPPLLQATPRYYVNKAVNKKFATLPWL